MSLLVVPILQFTNSLVTFPFLSPSVASQAWTYRFFLSVWWCCSTKAPTRTRGIFNHLSNSQVLHCIPGFATAASSSQAAGASWWEQGNNLALLSFEQPFITLVPFPRTLSTEAFKSCRFTSPGNQLSSSGRCRLAISLWRNQNGRKGTQRSDYRGFLFWFWFVWILLLLQGLIQSPWKSDWNACCSFGSLRHLSDDVGRFWVSSRMCFPNDRNILSDTLISSLYKQTCLSLTHLYLCSTYRFGVFFFFFLLSETICC